MLAGDVKKCLGYWWKGDPSASRSVEGNIQKAHHPFPLWQDQSSVSPLPYKEVIRICVMLVLLYGFEKCILTEALLLARLETFEGNLGKSVLKWPKHLSLLQYIAPDVAVMKCRVLVRMLGFEESNGNRHCEF